MTALILTQDHNQQTLSATVGMPVEVRLPPGTQWSDIQVSGDNAADPVLKRVAGSGNAQFVAARAGTVSLSAHGTPTVSPGQAAPRFMTAWHASVVVR